MNTVVPGTDLRRALGAYPTGVTVVTTRNHEGRLIGLTVNSFASLSLDPPLLLWSLANRSPNRDSFRRSGHFAINVLASHQGDLAMRFANARLKDKFEGLALHFDPDTQIPMIPESAATFLCASRDAIETGDHTLFIGVVQKHEAANAEPLVFHRGAFNQLAPSPL